MSKLSVNTKKRLEWVKPMISGANRALGDSISTAVGVDQTADPLTVIVVLQLLSKLQKDTKPHFRSFVRQWAESYYCSVPVINIGDKRVSMEVNVKQRIWQKDHTGKYFKKPVLGLFEKRIKDEKVDSGT